MTDAFLGRPDEWAAIRRFLEAATDSHRRLILSGETGIGKTILWESGVSLARELGMSVMVARPTLAERDLAHSALTDLLQPLVDDGGPPPLPAPQLEALDAVMLRRSVTANVDPRTIAAAVLGTLTWASTRGPLLIAIDDLQWIDSASRSALEYALRRADQLPIRLLATVRIEADGPNAALVSGPDDVTTLVRLGPLSQGLLHHLIRDRTGTALTRARLVRLEQASAGNPLLAIELARALGAATDWPIGGEPLPVPPSSRDLLAGRIERLSGADREVLFMAAAMADPSIDVLRGLRGTSAADGVTRAERHGLLSVEIGGRVRFVHPLMAEAALTAQPPDRRRGLHAELARQARSVEERGKHLALASDGPDAVVADGIEAAARSARQRGATGIAAELAESAANVTVAADREARVRRLISASRWFADSGDVERATALLEAAIAAVPAGDGRARALMLRSQIAGWSEGIEAAVAMAEQALADVVTLDLRVRILLAMAFELDPVDMPRALALTEEAVRLTAGFGDDPDADPELAACAVMQRAVLRLQMGLDADVDAFREAVGWLGAAPSRSDEGDEHRESLRARAMVWQWAADNDDLDAARAGAADDIRAAIERGHERPLPIAEADAALLDLAAGHWPGAAAHAEAAAAAAARILGSRQARVAASTAVAAVAAHRGDLAAARASALDGIAMAHQGDDFAVARLRRTLGFVALSAGDAEEAVSILEPLWRAELALGKAPWFEPGISADLVEAACAAGAMELASEVVGALDAGRQRLTRPSFRLLLARSLALAAAAAGDLDEAATRIGEALEFAADLPMPFEVARTELIAGRIARRRRERRVARDHLERARGAFAALGATAWVALAERDLARVGQRVSDVDALTETEDRAARLAAQGRTNREIGDQLFLTEKSVEGVLGRVYQKLGVRRRAELASRLPERSMD